MTKPFGDDLDLDALMLRVREAALTGTPGGTPDTNAAGEADVTDADLVRVLEVQAASNEDIRQSIAALVECLRTLRDDWTDAHARLRDEVRQLSAAVAELRSGTAASARRASRPSGKRQPAKGRRRRS